DHGYELAAGNVQRKPLKCLGLDRRAGVEGDFQVLCAEHQLYLLRVRRCLISGMTSAITTSTAVIRFRSCACKPMKSLFRARAMKMGRMPMEVSAPAWVCTNMAPARPTSALEMAMPRITMAPVFTP